MSKNAQKIFPFGRDIGLDDFNWKYLAIFIFLSAGLAVFTGTLYNMQSFSNPAVQINITENTVSPSRPIIDKDESVRFRNTGDEQLYISFERGLESFSLDSNASEIKKPGITTYYTVEKPEKTFRASIVVEED